MKRRSVIIVGILSLLAIALISVERSCPACGYYSSGRVKCYKCEGRGHVSVPGFDFFSDEVDCPVCTGRGLPPWKNCGNCKGRGRISLFSKIFGHTVYNGPYPEGRPMSYSPSFRGEHEWRCSYCKEKCVASTRYDFKEGYCTKCGHPRGSHR